MATNREELASDVQGLHQATLSLFADLSLDGVLRRITTAARQLVNARYAALGIPGANEGLEIFITEGISKEEIGQIAHQPLGKGLIGQIMHSGKTMRVKEISEHPKSYGFPEGHPLMHSFLGVPIVSYGRPIGHIYLTDKENAPYFTEHDQNLIELLAEHAAVAIENARLYRELLKKEDDLSRRNEQLALINQLTNAISSSMELKELMGDMLARVMDVFDSSVGDIFITGENKDQFEMVVHCCDTGPMWSKTIFQREEGFLGEVAQGRQLIWRRDFKTGTYFFREDILEEGLETLVGVPIFSGANVVGVLNLGFYHDRLSNDRDVGLLRAVAAGVGVGIDNARLKRQVRQIAIAEERERIAMDLHDGIIQSIFAVGLTLDSIRTMIRKNPDDAIFHLDHAIDSLNDNIRDIRSYILDMQPGRFLGTDFKEGIMLLSREFEANSLIEIELYLEDGAIQHLGLDESKSFLQITQEALANIAKHAEASRVWVSVRELDERIYLQIIDNGRGFNLQDTQELLGHGLSNMEKRTHQIGGEFEVVTSLREGTTITAQLKINSDLDQTQPLS
ncbi:MAG: GAF domain-containing sensor histidine kinase [Chloroflexi bacterium]|nr:GAF domain-containing sensor histidine kinase [Chloroflexota bacterium]